MLLAGGLCLATLASSTDRSGVRSLPDGYQVEYADVRDGVYWALYRDGERVNGGISESEELASYASSYYAAWDEYIREGGGKLVIDFATGLAIRTSHRDGHDL